MCQFISGDSADIWVGSANFTLNCSIVAVGGGLCLKATQAALAALKYSSTTIAIGTAIPVTITTISIIGAALGLTVFAICCISAVCGNRNFRIH